jgi:alpha-tubulin suppressor-like RCC1 family protein
MRRSSLSAFASAPLSNALLAAIALAGTLAATGCSDGITAPSEQSEAGLIVTASVVGTPVATLAVEVTGPGIDQRLVFNLNVVNGTATGTIKMPPGDARTITVRAYDSNGDVTHEGSKTVDVKRGQNPPVNIPMVPRAGQVPITVTLGSVSITVDPANAAVDVGATLQLMATIRAPNGDVLPGPVAWATTDPTKASVNQMGLVTALAEGSVEIVATYAGVAGASAITVQLATSLAFTAVSTGRSSSCGITAVGTYCWGENQWGQLGSPSPSRSLGPQLVAGGLAFTAVSLGSLHACGITEEGKAYCWGNNDLGQLGDGTITKRTTPTEVAGTLTFTAISAGFYHTCGLATNGKAYCWGYGANGQLGNDNGVDQRIPVEVAGAHTFIKLFAGSFHTCGIADDAKAYCWGYGDYGTLGDGSGFEQHVPVKVAGAQTFTTLSPGQYHTCGLATDGKAYCWGNGSSGRLGTGDLELRLVPTEVAGGHTFTVLSAWESGTCGIATDGKSYCWGYNAFGQLGNGAFDNGSIVPVEVVTSLRFNSLSRSSNAETICGIVGTTAYCWGDGGFGQLGNGTFENSSVPVPVSKP